MLKGTLIYGVGINDADYPVNVTTGEGKKRQIQWRCPYYQKWVNMLDRCYGKTHRPSYRDTEVCKDWHRFSNFLNWMQSQDWLGKELDKDLCVTGNLYSPDTCVFLDKKVNMLLLAAKPKFHSGHWVAQVRGANKVRVKFRGKDRAEVMKSCLQFKLAQLDGLSNFICSREIKKLVINKLTAFYEENL